MGVLCRILSACKLMSVIVAMIFLVQKFPLRLLRFPLFFQFLASKSKSFGHTHLALRVAMVTTLLKLQQFNMATLSKTGRGTYPTESQVKKALDTLKPSGILSKV